MTSTGIVLFAYNTDEIDYIRLATIAARYARQYMPDRKVCLITDAGTWDWFSKGEYADRAEQAFDDIVLVESGKTTNRRTHFDSPWYRFSSDFKNGNKHKVIKYTPYDRTLLIDIDYIIQNKSLDYVFDSDSGVALFHEAESLIREDPALPQQFLSEQGIPHLWSTAIYFDKHDELAQMFFNVWAHVADNYEFYKFLYGFPGTMYRTDFCVSIAVHLMNGMGEGELIDSLPGKLINMSQHDDIAKINNIDEWIYMVNDRKENWQDSLTLISRENVHVMNKRSLDRNFETIMQKLDGDEE